MTRGFSGISNYSSLVFDCDGVILNSNRIKTNAFYETTKQFGNKYASALVDYHVLNGGVSRYVKFNYFITKILNRKLDPILYEELLYRFANEVKKGLNDCEVAIGLKELSLLTSKANWLIVSGGEQSELRETFAAKNLEQYFLGGIFGSPSTKDILLNEKKKEKTLISLPFLLATANMTIK